MATVKEVVNFIEEMYPKTFAYSWDNVGLQVGNNKQEVKKVLIALDCSVAVLDEAIATNVELIICHHPLLFKGVKTIDEETLIGQKIFKAISHRISIYAAHTNYDIAKDGMNDQIANKLQLINVSPFDMIDETNGLGRIGQLEKPLTFNEFTAMVKQVFDLKAVNVVQASKRDYISNVAVIGGSGAKSYDLALVIGADVLVTGDVTHHVALDALEAGLHIVDVGHFAERLMVKHIASLLNQRFGNNFASCAVEEKNPLQTL